MNGRAGVSTGVCAGLVLLLLACRVAPDDASAAEHLERALLRDRFMAAALAGEANWHPCDTSDGTAPITRERCGQAPAARSKSLENIAGTARAARRWLQSDSTPRALHATGLLALRSLENARGIDRAVEALERASRLAPNNAGFLNDLAAAYLAVAERDQQLLPALKALDAIERAMACDSTLAAVLFNRALILERLYLLRDAERAWTRYTTAERRAPWRAEGEARLRLVRARLGTDARLEAIDSLAARDDSAARRELRARVQRWPEGARDASFALFRQWGIAVLGRDSAGAAEALRRARAIADVLGAMNADHTVILAVRALETHPRDRRQLAALARAHVEFADGLTGNFTWAQNDAVAALARAEPSLREAGSPLAQWAAMYRGAAESFRGHYAIADRLLHDVRRTAGPDQPAVVGKALWLLGVSQALRGAYDVANHRYREARPFFERAGEPENLGAISYLLAEGLKFSGQIPAGQSEALLGLRLLSPFRRSSHLNNHLTQAVAEYARADGLSHAALAIMDEALDVAPTLNRPKDIAFVRVARAKDLIALGNLNAARAELDEALRWVDKIGVGPGHDRTLADVLLVGGEIERAKDPEAALRTLAHVASVYRGLKIDALLAETLYQEAVAAQGVGDEVSARARLQEAIDAIERQSASFASPETRAMLYETVERVFDATIRIELANKRPDSAFAYLERGRVAAWAPDARLAIGNGRTPASLTRIRELLPANAVFVEYALLPDTLAMWIVSSHGSRPYALGVRRDSVAQLVDRFTREMDDPNVDTTSARARLFDLLVAPFASELASGGEIVVVPDRELARVPFAALWNRGTGRYVLEDYRVRTLPSAAFLVAASRATSPDSRASALVIGNPKLDAATVAELPPLPGAFREAQQVARLYRRPQLLTGAEASRDRVVELLPKYGVFHFAGHAVANGDQPELSYLALASQQADAVGTLRAAEIGKLRLSNLQIVVLSACSTLNPRRSRMGAIAGLAYSFMRAGAPATVSTLWDVDDEVTTELLVSFHNRFAGGMPAAEALRLAQQDALSSRRPELRSPRAWGAFVYTGP